MQDTEAIITVLQKSKSIQHTCSSEAEKWCRPRAIQSRSEAELHGVANDKGTIMAMVPLAHVAYRLTASESNPMTIRPQPSGETCKGGDGIM